MYKDKKFLKILFTDFFISSRDKKEVDYFSLQSYRIYILHSKIDIKDLEMNHKKTFYKVFDLKLKRIKNPVLRKFFVLRRYLSYLIYSIRIKPDVISGHDLKGLMVAYFSRLLSFKKKPKLIYDSHEYELGRTGRGKISKFFVYHLEKYLIKRADLVIMVNDSIAEKVQSNYKLKEKPLVIRNIPHYWHLDIKTTQTIRHQLLSELNLKDDSFLVMYHGGISLNRGIQTLLKAAAMIDNVGVIILGYGPEETIKTLKDLANSLQINERVSFQDAVHIDELWKYVSAVDVGVSLAPNINLNHYYMLPNKLFENIQALTPVIASDFPEIRKIVKGYEVGLLVDPESPDAIAEAIKTMRDNQEEYAKFKNNLLKAKEELHWDNEKLKLEVVKDIFYEK